MFIVLFFYTFSKHVKYFFENFFLKKEKEQVEQTDRVPKGSQISKREVLQNQKKKIQI